MNCNTCLLMTLTISILVVLPDQIHGMPPAQCSLDVLEDAPPRIRKVCVALSTIYDLGAAMESYLDDKVPVIHENIPLAGSGVKRQDVDHVFLRFGRRR